jgi:hypothetical protein
MTVPVVDADTSPRKIHRQRGFAVPPICFSTSVVNMEGAQKEVIDPK